MPGALVSIGEAKERLIIYHSIYAKINIDICIYMYIYIICIYIYIYSNIYYIIYITSGQKS